MLKVTQLVPNPNQGAMQRDTAAGRGSRPERIETRVRRLLSQEPQDVSVRERICGRIERRQAITRSDPDQRLEPPATDRGASPEIGQVGERSRRQHPLRFHFGQGLHGAQAEANGAPLTVDFDLAVQLGMFDVRGADRDSLAHEIRRHRT
jgi:hypothetical protein